MPIPNGPRGGASRVNNSSPSHQNQYGDSQLGGLPSLDELDGGYSPEVEEETFSRIPVSDVSSESQQRRTRTYTPPDLSDIDSEYDDDDDDDEYDYADSGYDDYEDEDDYEEEEEEAPTFASRGKPTRPTKAGKQLKKVKEEKAPKTSRRSKKNDPEDENNEDNTFIDTKNMKLKPFGERDGVKRKAKVSEFDERKNIRRKQQMRTMALLGIGGIIMLMGIKNALIPPPTLNEAEVQNIVTETVGDTGFPLNSGRGFAENFMKAYLNQGATDQVSAKVLNYYYTGALAAADSSGNVGNSIFSNDFQLKTLYGPTIFSSRALTANSASYTVGALTVSQNAKSPAPSDGSTAKWTFFNVNVYFNTETNSFKIAKDSPTVIPPINIADATVMPPAESLGGKVQDDALTASIQPVIQGYVQGYSTSSPQEHSSLDQYVTNTGDNTLATGLNNRYKLGGDINDAVTFDVFTDDEVPGNLKARVNVIWQDNADVENNIQYTSTYVMSLAKQTNGKYLVSKFSPEYYVPGSTD